MSDSGEFQVKTQYIDFNKIFLVSDTHWGVRSNSLEWIQNQQAYFINFFIPYVKSKLETGDILCILGDWFDSRQLLDIHVMNISIDIIMELATILPIYMMTGNHDIYKKNDTDVNSLAAFRHIPNVTIYEKPIIITNNTSNILLMPWIGSKELEESYLEDNKVEYVFAHTTIEGFKYDNGRDITTGGVSVNKFSHIKRLFSGHIHKRQEVKNLIYLGSPYHTKRSDIGNSKGIYTFIPDENEIVFEKNTLSPVFQRIKLENLLDLTLDHCKYIFHNNYTDVIIPDKYIHIFHLTKFIDLLEDCKYKKIETIGEGRVIDNAVTIADKIDIKDILSLIELAIEELGLNMETLVKLKLLNRDYYEKAYKGDSDLI
jgi:DNA repair exonuclease SbcCD nuclease subunit